MKVHFRPLIHPRRFSLAVTVGAYDIWERVKTLVNELVRCRSANDMKTGVSESVRGICVYSLRYCSEVALLLT